MCGIFGAVFVMTEQDVDVDAALRSLRHRGPDASGVYKSAGVVLGPFEAWLLLRGMRTLFVRVRHASETALRLARHFERHPALAAVL